MNFEIKGVRCQVVDVCYDFFICDLVIYVKYWERRR